MPSNGLFFFFDVQPIAVKAYGGQKWTTEKALILAKNQKTKGMFYLFLVYEAKTGIVLWAFYRSKGSRYVCKFMKQIRHRFPQQQIWMALDQDRPHPRICRFTRSTMRELKLRWISLPKRSPDDNPVENIFSDIQQNILDCSDDQSVLATQCRISSHLRKRNKRSERKIRIPSLLGFNKH